MRISVFRITNFILLSFAIILSSCKQNSPSEKLLVQAQNIADSNPAEALSLLDSISNPENMDKDSYMRYIVTHVQAKFKAKQDIKNDTLIFEAQKYFEDKNDYNQAALANFYSGNIQYKKDMLDKALASYLQAENYARKTNNNILLGRSLNNIGYIYFEQDVMDSAIVYLQEALSYYEKEKNTNSFKLQTINSLGRAYEDIGGLDSAYHYFDKGLDLAKQTENKKYQTIYTHNLGVVYKGKGDYQKATEHLHRALINTDNATDSVKIYRNLSEVYNNLSQPDSVKIYTDLMKSKISETTDDYTLRTIYQSLIHHYKGIGNYEEALRYAELQKAANQRIKDADNSQKLFDADKKFYLAQREKDLKDNSTPTAFYIVLGIVILIVASLMIKDIRQAREYKKRNNQLQEKLDRQKTESLEFMQDMYQGIISKLPDVEKQNFINKHGDKSLQIRLRELVSLSRQRNSKQLSEWAKDYLRQTPFGEQAISKLRDNDQILLALSSDNVSDNEISLLLNIPIEDVHAHKLKLRPILIDIGLSDTQIEQILFTGN